MSSRDKYELIRFNRKRTYRNHLAVAVALHAIGSCFVHSVLLARRLERQFWAPGFPDRDGAPSRQLIRQQV
jgi:hypothetical protein